jgi:hypothetical protein
MDGLHILLASSISFPATWLTSSSSSSAPSIINHRSSSFLLSISCSSGTSIFLYMWLDFFFLKIKFLSFLPNMQLKHVMLIIAADIVHFSTDNQFFKKEILYFSCLIIAYCVLVYLFLKREEKQESERVREESLWRELSRDSSMRVQRLTIIHYRTCGVCSFKRIAYQYQCALALGVSPPSPHAPWAVGGVFPVSVSWCFGCMNGAWLPVCSLGGPADDLPIFGKHTRKAPLR